MLARLCLTSLLLLLAACQNTSVNRDYDSSRDFGAYRSWSWQEPALQYRPDDPRLRSDLTEQRVRDALSEQLEQRGLRAAALGAGADLKVQAWLIVDGFMELRHAPWPWRALMLAWPLAMALGVAGAALL